MKQEENILLEKFGKKLPYAVPENYFENFAAQWSSSNEAVSHSIHISRIVRTWLYMAAMFLGVFFMGRLAYNSYRHSQQSHLAENYETYIDSQVADADIIDYYFTGN